MCALPFYVMTFAQSERDDRNVDIPVERGFQKDRLFTGGSANLGFGSGSTMLGIEPQLGYSVSDWADVGINFNLNYISQRYFSSPEKLRQTIYGPGAFVRLFPVNFLFGTAQFEYNTIRQKYIPGTPGAPTQISKVSANSLLVGAGYAGGRQPGSNSYYFMSIMWDVYGDINSPYVDQYQRSSPVIRAGYNIGLFQKRYNRMPR